jgi:hypothetical protein
LKIDTKIPCWHTGAERDKDYNKDTVCYYNLYGDFFLGVFRINPNPDFGINGKKILSLKNKAVSTSTQF